MGIDSLEDKKNKVSGHAFVSANCIMGTGNVFREGVIVRDNVVIGDNNYFGPYCIIGELPESKEYFNNSTSKVRIGSNNVFYKGVTIDGGTTDVTIVSNDCYFLRNSHVGHDAKINNNCTIKCDVIIGGWVEIEENANLGVSCFIHQRKIIPKNVTVGAHGVIIKKSELTANCTYVGVPVKCVG